jgi:hypothetical protein
MTTTATTDVLGTSLADLPAVHLDELTDQAALQRRVDRKYVVPVAACLPLLADLGSRGAHVLEIEGRRTFGYDSVYLDTADLTCYLQAAHRRPRRFKVRTRTYVDSGQCWLEVKTRDRRGWTVKHRTAYDVRDRALLTTEGRLFVEQVLAAAGLGLDGGTTLDAALRSVYRRSTLHLPRTRSRVTLDTRLMFRGLGPTSPRPGTAAASEALRSVTPGVAAQEAATQEAVGLEAVTLPGYAVVETKTDGRPCAADRLLWAGGYRPVRISKYGTGLAALDPDLPANPWQRVLGRELFRPAGSS